MADLATAPQSIGGVLDSGFKLFTASFKQVFWLALAAALIYAPFGIIARRYAEAPFSSAAIRGLWLPSIAFGIVALIVWSIILVRMNGVAHDRFVSVGEAFSVGLRRTPAVFVAGLLYSLASAIGTLLIFIPGFMIMVYWLFGPIAAVTERLGPIAGLGYSFQLVRGHWWRTAAVLTIIGIIALVVYVVLGLIAALAVAANLEQLAQGQMPWYLDFIVNPLLSAVASPLLYSLLLATFYDLKLRHEGGDLAERIAAAT